MTWFSSLLRDAIMGVFPEFPMSLTFSMPDESLGWGGKGRIRVWMEDGWVKRSGSKMGRFFGVIRMVILSPKRASLWVRFRSGSMWPCAGNGNASMWRVLVGEILVEDVECMVVDLGRNYSIWWRMLSSIYSSQLTTHNKGVLFIHELCL